METKWEYKMPSDVDLRDAEKVANDNLAPSVIGDAFDTYRQAVAAFQERRQRPSITIDVRGVPELQETLTKLKTVVEVAETERDAEVKRRNSAEMTMVAMVKKIEGLDDRLVRAYKSRDSWRGRAERAEGYNTTLVEEQRAVLKGEPDHAPMKFRSGDQWFEMCLPRKL